VDVALEKPVTVVGRSDLDHHLLEEALGAGTRFIRKRVRSLERAHAGWSLNAGGLREDYELVLGADGANSLVSKSLSVKLRPHESYRACGYFVKGLTENRIVIKFFHGLEGYAWVFPGPEETSVGICGSGHRHGTAYLKKTLHQFMSNRYPERTLKHKRPFAGLIPSLSSIDLKRLKIAGKTWALAGDAAGLADPITGEGIYYAIRSSEILARSISTGTMDTYPRRVHEEVGRDLARAASLKGLFFSPPFVQNTVLLAKESPAIRSLLSDLYAGTQDYTSLEGRLTACVLPCVKDMLSPGRLPSLGRALWNLGLIVGKYRPRQMVK
jgi:flavin-dependent dehydrogenase